MHRGGYTVVELLVSTISASLLLTGLASSLFLAVRSFDGTSNAAATTRATDVHNDILVDLKHATGFVSRASDAVTFTVPDRDGDLVDETLTYQWTGLPSAELQIAVDGGAPVTLLEDVQDFNLAYLNRFVTGSAAAPPPLDPNQWGTRWVLPTSIFGYDTQFLLTETERRRQVGTRATLTEDGTVQALTVYLSFPFGGNSDFTMAIYSVNTNDNPKDLIVHTALSNASSAGWYTLPVAPTVLTAGEYYLAVSYKSSYCYHHYDILGGGETHVSVNDASKKNQWQSSWNSISQTTKRLSIYATYEPN
ncbi:Uncharacterized protein SCF082_LOCUS17981 [Durusdinium trenchii]|uniref:Prepilin-type N-terminal cleavage/methylation domain-containing protein n=1 Tax=Durusdinium trenchii TaxID=1381693 RepID=A0ABP0KL70_9DINO